MRLEVRNESGEFFPYTNFTKLSVKQSIDTISGVFSFTAVQEEGFFLEDYPIKMGSLCRVTIDNVPVLTGYIEIIEPSGDAKSDRITISGRDITCDLIDSTIPGEVNFTDADISLEDLINTIQASVGLTRETFVPERMGRPLLPIINEVPDLENYKKGEIESPSAGQRAFDFLQDVARKRQVLLTTDGNGSIVITQSGSSPLGFDITLKRNDTKKTNNVLSSSASFDNTRRYSRYIFGSSGNLQGLNLAGQQTAAAIVDLELGLVDEGMSRPTRTLFILDENSSDVETLKSRAAWELNIRKALSKKYSCVVSGHTVKAGVPFWFNKIANVRDDKRGINASMLVKSVAFTEDLDGAKETSFEFVGQFAYTLEVTEEQAVEDTNVVGEPFVLGDPVTNLTLDDFINNTVTINVSDLIDDS